MQPTGGGKGALLGDFARLCFVSSVRNSSIIVYFCFFRLTAFLLCSFLGFTTFFLSPSPSSFFFFFLREGNPFPVERDLKALLLCTARRELVIFLFFGQELYKGFSFFFFLFVSVIDRASSLRRLFVYFNVSLRYQRTFFWKLFCYWPCSSVLLFSLWRAFSPLFFHCLLACPFDGELSVSNFFFAKSILASLN